VSGHDIPEFLPVHVEGVAGDERSDWLHQQLEVHSEAAQQIPQGDLSHTTINMESLICLSEFVIDDTHVHTTTLLTNISKKND